MGVVIMKSKLLLTLGLGVMLIFSHCLMIFRYCLFRMDIYIICFNIKNMGVVIMKSKLLLTLGLGVMLIFFRK